MLSSVVAMDMLAGSLCFSELIVDDGFVIDSALADSVRAIEKYFGGLMMLKKIIATFALAALTVGSAGTAIAECTNDVWNKVMDRGTVVIGVKADYKPWGFRDSDGNIVGMEIDMAMDVGAKMGVAVELVVGPVIQPNAISGNRQNRHVHRNHVRS